MSNKTMLIDAAHPDEARVAILHDGELYDYDFVTASKSQLKGNIYLAKITRVEPSLQAAFVEYGGGKQGFLPFSEIHPDYYQMPVSDKQKLLEEQIAEAEAEEAEEEEAFEREQAARESRHKNRRKHRTSDEDSDGTYDNEDEEEDEDFNNTDTNEDFLLDSEMSEGSIQKPVAPTYMKASQEDIVTKSSPLIAEDSAPFISNKDTQFSIAGAPNNTKEVPIIFPAITPDFAPEPFDIASNLSSSEDAEEGLGEPNISEKYNDVIDSETHNNLVVSAEEGAETLPHMGENATEKSTSRHSKPQAFYRRYRIQEVIKHNQIVLVQVTKEERGNKGCSLTTYISLAGRYCVLMPNSPKGGGISRKISDRETRKRLKSVASSLRTNRSMSMIIRTAGIDRESEDIKRDYEYLAKLWNKIREETLSSSAPSLVYEESNLIKRAIRDLYTNDIETIEVEGEAAYKEARNFMQLLLPSHEKNIKRYRNQTHLFTKYGVDEDLEELLQPHVRLPSGGYLIINPTEALISIDVNSGRSTTERNVEETALKTNLEAAEEVAKQMRLRDLAGLVVIDFIDMGYGKHRRQVERTMRDAVKADRAKIQLGRISNFGLMELSRQRMRPSLSETLGITCPHCKGAGVIHSPETVAFQIIRALEKEAATREYKALRITAPSNVALLLLNEKREILYKLEARHEVQISVQVDDSIQTASFRLIKLTFDGKEVAHEHAQSPKKRRRRDESRRNQRKIQKTQSGVTIEDAFTEDAEVSNRNADEENTPIITSEAHENTSDDKPRRRGKRGGKRNNRRQNTEEHEMAPPSETAEDLISENQAEGEERESAPKRRSRGKRGGRNRGNRNRKTAIDEDAFSAEEAQVGAPEKSGNEGDVMRPEQGITSPKRQESVVALSEVARPAERAHNANTKIASFSGEASPNGDDSDKPKRKGWWGRVLEK